MPEPASHDDVVTALRAAGCVYAEEEAAHLIEAAGPGGDLATLVQRRVDGEPLEWIVGWAWFGTEDGEGLRVVVRPGVFVPRGRTIELALAADEILPNRGTLLELCCGSGAISAYLRHLRPGLDVVAADLDPVAVACAGENLPGARVLQGDLFDPVPDELRGAVDVLVANAPYVPSEMVALMPPEARDHEPLHTLDGGPDGLELLRRIAADAPQWLRPGGTRPQGRDRPVPARPVEMIPRAGQLTTGRIDPDGTSVVLGRLPD